MSPITIRQFEAGRHAILATNGDVQIGWAVRVARSQWFVTDMDDARLVGPFRTLSEAEKAATEVLKERAGDSNPGW
jgi:hypothetical protein